MTYVQRLKADMPGLYNSWRGMRNRCMSLTRKDAHCYAAKGVTCCAEWDDVQAFVEWALQNGYRPGLTLDRKNGEKGYAPDNCRWADRKEQARNLSKNKVIEHGGIRRCLSEWSEATGIGSGLLLARLTRLGWSVEAALTTPVGAIKPGPKR